MYDLPPDTLERPRAGPLSPELDEQLAVGGCDCLAAALDVDGGDLTYDYAWYPAMSAADPASCCFASTSRVRRRRAAGTVGMGVQGSCT